MKTPETPAAVMPSDEVRRNFDIARHIARAGRLAAAAEVLRTLHVPQEHEVERLDLLARVHAQGGLLTSAQHCWEAALAIDTTAAGPLAGLQELRRRHGGTGVGRVLRFALVLGMLVALVWLGSAHFQRMEESGRAHDGRLDALERALERSTLDLQQRVESVGAACAAALAASTASLTTQQGQIAAGLTAHGTEETQRISATVDAAQRDMSSRFDAMQAALQRAIGQVASRSEAAEQLLVKALVTLQQGVASFREAVTIEIATARDMNRADHSSVFDALDRLRESTTTDHESTQLLVERLAAEIDKVGQRVQSMATEVAVLRQQGAGERAGAPAPGPVGKEKNK